MVITRTGTSLCPVAMLEHYLTMACVSLDESDNFIFRGIIHTKKGSRLRDKGTCSLSYTTVWETVLEKLEAIGLEKSQYGLHSLGAGGASAAANAGVPDQDVQAARSLAK